MLQKKGRIFRNGSGESAPRTVYAKTIAAALRAEPALQNQTIKKVQRWTGAGERTVKNWLDGISGPRGEHLLQLAYYSDSVFESILMLAERDSAVAGTKLRRICDEMAKTLGTFKGFIEDEGSPQNGKRPSRRFS